MRKITLPADVVISGTCDEVIVGAGKLMKTSGRGAAAEGNQRAWHPQINSHLGQLAGLTASLLIALDAWAVTFVPPGAVWRFLDNGSDAGSAWIASGFDDSGWRSGPAQLGYGDGDEATGVVSGPVATNKYITTYFRHTFVVADPRQFADLTIFLLRDDGAVLYLNGREILRDNMPVGAINYRTPAGTSVGGAAESAFYPASVPASDLVSGLNVLAVEIHQANGTSTDLSFDLGLVGNERVVVASLTAPANDASEVSLNATLAASIPDAAGGTLTATFWGRPAGPAPGPDFTIIALPDTQYYVAGVNHGQPSTFTAQVDWIVSNRVTRNIGFVTHLGDLVEHGQNSGANTEWLLATNAIYRLEDPATTPAPHGIPYGIALGNHDFSTGTNSLRLSDFYNEFIGVEHFAGRDYYGGHFGTNNNNSYQLFSAGGLDFIILHLEYNTTANTNVLNWADGLLKTYPDRRAIVTSHYLLETGNPAAFGGQGRAVYDALKVNPNLFLMLCGHVPGEGRRQDTFNDRTVHTLMSDYQGRTNGGSGWLRILEFSPSNNVIRVKTYSPTFDQYDTNASAQFVLDYDMRSGGGFTPLGVVSGISGATDISIDWSGLAHATAYEWCVTVSNGNRTVTSPIWRFVTAPNRPPSIEVKNVAMAPGAPGFIPSVTLAIEAAASDSDGTVSKVEFFADSTRIGQAASSPYFCTWTHAPVGAYSITAVAEDNEGLQTVSAPFNLFISLPDTPGEPKLDPPANLTATAVSTGQVNLQWSDQSAGELGFVLERSTNGLNYVPVATLPADAQDHVDTGLVASTRYYYRLYAYDGSSASAYTAPANAATPAAAGEGGVFRVRLQLDRVQNAIQLAWPSVAGVVYRVVAKDSVSDAVWSDRSQDVIAVSSTTSWAELIDGSAPHRFYGVRIVH